MYNATVAPVLPRGLGQGEDNPKKIFRRGILGRVWQRPAFREAILEVYKHMRMYLFNSIFKHLCMSAGGSKRLVSRSRTRLNSRSRTLRAR